MRSYCCVPGCDSGKRREKKRSKEEGKKSKTLFMSPKDDLFEKWQMAILSTNKELTRKDRVCELHFHEDDIERFFITKIKDGSVSKIERERIVLKRGAVPSIFPNVSTCFTQNLLESKLVAEKNLSTHATKLENKVSHHSVRSYSTIKTSDDTQKVHENFEHTKQNTHVSFLQQKENVDVNFQPKKENTDEDFLQNENVSHVNDSFTYFKLLENLSHIKKPNNWWSIAPVVSFITCVRWNAQFVIDKRVMIEHDLNVKIFVKERQIIIMDCLKINSIDEVSSILFKVESFGICTGAIERSQSNCLVCLPASTTGRRRSWCTNCQTEKKRIVDEEKKVACKKRENRLARRNKILRQKLVCITRKNSRKMLKIERLKQIIENYKKMNADVKKTAAQKIIYSFPQSQQESVQSSLDTSRNS